MSNPSINRWGFNQFWRRLWYTDKHFNQKLHQDKFFNDLVNLYLHYGVWDTSNIFINKRWDLVAHDSYKKTLNSLMTKYYRIAYFKNPMLEEPASYRLRVKIKNIYITRTWIFRYQNWLVINFYAFQPVKKLINKNNKLPKLTKSTDFLAFGNPRNLFGIKRLRLALFYLFFKKNNNSANFYYKF